MTGNPTVDALAAWFVAVVAVITGLGLLWRILLAIRRVVDRLDQFWDDWEGVPDRPGVPGTPGLVARMAHVEQRLNSIEAQL